jgi:hypothetical protein
MSSLEKKYMIERVHDGLNRYLENGGKLGRPPILTEEKTEKIYRLYKRMKKKQAKGVIGQLAKKNKLQYHTLYQIIKKMKEREESKKS